MVVYNSDTAPAHLGSAQASPINLSKAMAACLGALRGGRAICCETRGVQRPSLRSHRSGRTCSVVAGRVRRKARVGRIRAEEPIVSLTRRE